MTAAAHQGGSKRSLSISGAPDPRHVGGEQEEDEGQEVDRENNLRAGERSSAFPLANTCLSPPLVLRASRMLCADDRHLHTPPEGCAMRQPPHLAIQLPLRYRLREGADLRRDKERAYLLRSYAAPSKGRGGAAAQLRGCAAARLNGRQAKQSWGGPHLRVVLRDPNFAVGVDVLLVGAAALLREDEEQGRLRLPGSVRAGGCDADRQDAIARAFSEPPPSGSSRQPAPGRREQ